MQLKLREFSDVDSYFLRQTQDMVIVICANVSSFPVTQKNCFQSVSVTFVITFQKCFTTSFTRAKGIIKSNELHTVFLGSEIIQP